MKKLIFFGLLIVFFSLFAAADADVPPDPGYTRVTVNLIVEPQEDFEDYRFFIKSGANIKEIILKKGKRSDIQSLGGGAWYRNGTFLAVPKKSLAALSETSSGEPLNEMQRAIYDGKVGGTIELIQHSFTREVRGGEASALEDPVYRIEKDLDKGLASALVSSETKTRPHQSNERPKIYSNEPKTPAFWATVVGASVLTLLAVCLGVWAIRRSKMKTV